MKPILISIVVLMAVAASGCSTIGHAMHGAGEDLQKAGEWVRTR
jgi:predicted small secreted protein